jgi:putative oxidoreductase
LLPHRWAEIAPRGGEACDSRQRTAAFSLVDARIRSTLAGTKTRAGPRGMRRPRAAKEEHVGFLKPYEDKIYALMRMVTGFLFLFHGVQKLFGAFGGLSDQMPRALGYTAGTIELVGGTLVMIGLFAAPAAFICSGQMAVAYFMVHQPMGLFPITNHGELAALYCWVFLFIAARGAGTWSVDASRRAD